MVFKGDKKTGSSLLSGPENRLRDVLVPLVPGWLQTHHLTLTTIAWSALVVVFSFLARHDIRWLWMVSLMIVLQYVTDLLDGAVGRTRDTGLVKWGYYMDHFLDYLFLCAILIGYSLLLPDAFKYRLFFIMAFFGAFMVNSFLSFAATNEFRITYLRVGPTEVRIIFIAVNTLLILVGRTYMVTALAPVLLFATFGLFVTVYRTQKALWELDMRNKHGDSAAVAPAPAPGCKSVGSAAAFLKGLSAKKITRNFVLSVAIALLAVTVLSMKFFYPRHRAAAILIYAVSWLPLLAAFREKRALLAEQGRELQRKLRPYALHVAVAALLIVMARTAWVLVPTELSPLLRMSDQDLVGNVGQDVQNAYILGLNMDSLTRWAAQNPAMTKPPENLSPDEKAAIRNFWRDFVATSMELEILKSRYRGFYQVDYLVRPTIHADAFLIAYASFISQYSASLKVENVVAGNPMLKALLNEADPAAGIPADSFYQMKRRLAHQDELLRLLAGAAYLALVRKDLDAPEELLAMVDTRIRDAYKNLGKRPELFLESPLDFLEKQAFTAWFPFQKEVAFQMSRVRATGRANFVTYDMIEEQMANLRPGDLILERRNWNMSNVGIPGFWPHVALYIGAPAELDEYFGQLEAAGGETASAHIAGLYPAAFGEFTTRTATGRTRRVLEALRDGVVFTAFEESANADYVAVLRPHVPRRDKFQAILTAFSHAGKPYDFNFDFATDNVLVCTELVYKSYKAAPGLDFQLALINGRQVLPPNSIAQKFDAESGLDQPQLDFVLFIDGNERKAKATLSDEQSFSATWKRPKWDILLE